MVDSGTLLIVEDDSGLVELLGKKLEGIGYQLVFRLSAIEAIEWLRDNRPMLMVLANSLTDMNASELITELNQAGVIVPPFIAVIFPATTGWPLPCISAWLIPSLIFVAVTLVPLTVP